MSLAVQPELSIAHVTTTASLCNVQCARVSSRNKSQNGRISTAVWMRIFIYPNSACVRNYILAMARSSCAQSHSKLRIATTVGMLMKLSARITSTVGMYS